MERILIVDDEKNYLLVLSAFLKDEGYPVNTAESAEAALEFLEDQEADLILTDMTMPGLGGMAFLEVIQNRFPACPVIMMTAHGTVELAVTAMKRGAFDYLTKPFKNEDLLRTVRKALEMSRLARRNQVLQEALNDRYSFGNIIGKSKPMLEIYRLVEKVAVTRANILVTGESGTGKELVAKAIHYNSPRSAGPFVAVNCSALTENLLESELFGHERGAFTDAKSTRRGRFELADGGTIFLDEIGEMSPSLQAKVLRVIQERSFERVGGQETIKVDSRLVAATHRDLKKEVAAGRFREDLFYRLNVVSLMLPPLRARLDDLPLLVNHFLQKFAREEKRYNLAINQDALRFLYAYSWPGNVRELENVIERAVILCSDDHITPRDLPPEITSIHLDAEDLKPPEIPRPGRSEEAGPASPAWAAEFIEQLPPELSLEETLSFLEEGLIRRALAHGDGVQSRAAEKLGLRKNVFKYKWDKYHNLPPSPLAAELASLTPDGHPLVAALEAVEESLLRKALSDCRGVQAHAAERLGIKKNLMQYKMKKYALKGPDY